MFPRRGSGIGAHCHACNRPCARARDDFPRPGKYVPACCCSVARSSAAASSCPAAVPFSPSAGRKVPQALLPPRFVPSLGRGFPTQAPVRCAVFAASKILHAGGRTGATSPPISSAAVICPSGPTRPAAVLAHRVGLAPPCPGHPPFFGDAQATAARGEYTVTIGNGQAVAPIDDDTADINLQKDWSLGDEEEFQRQSNLGSMDGGGYCTNLICEGINNFDWSDMGSQPEEQQAPDVEVNTFVRPNQKRTKNFSDDEDNLLVSAWINVSLDAVQGAEQSRSTYWN